MDEQGFRKFIKHGKRVPKGLDEKTMRTNIRSVKEFEDFIKRRKKRRFEDATESDVRAFIKHLRGQDRCNLDNLIGLLRYARFLEHERLTVILLTILDSGDILPPLCDSFKARYGERKHSDTLGGYRPPPIGTTAKKMPKATMDFLRRLERGIGEEETRLFLLRNCPHVGPDDQYSEEKEMLREAKDVDEYLAERHRRAVKELEEHFGKGTVFFTQRIDQDVIDFVKNNPEIQGGVRKGNAIVFTKIPYMTIEYLREKDPKVKRYYFCHCPLARESILSGEDMSRSLCYCSAGYVLKPFEVAFGKRLNVKILESVLWGDPSCRFAIEIPEKFLPKGKRTSGAP